MLTVRNLNNAEEALNGLQGFEMVEEVNGAFTVKFTSLTDRAGWTNPGHELLDETGVIDVDGYLMVMQQLREDKSRKAVTARSTFFELGAEYVEEIHGGTDTFDGFIKFTLAGLGYTYEIQGITESRLIANYGQDNVLKLIQALCGAFEAEYKIMPGKHIIFSKKIGPDNDFQYRYRHNIKALSKNVDRSNVRTAIIGYGANGLKVTYRSPNESKFGTLWAEPVRDDKFTTPESMIEHLKQTLQDEPDATFELDSLELLDRELGERVWLIYEPLDMEFQTRILSKKSGYKNGKLYTSSVVLGNKMPNKFTDVLISQKVEIDQNRKETRSRFEQTNDRITLEVETIGESVANLTVVSEQIGLTVTDLSGRMGGAEASLIVQSGQISSKVSQTDFNGNQIVSMINQTPGQIIIDAQKINLNGYVTVQGLKTPGSVIIDEGNINGSSFTVGRGAGVPVLSMYATQGSHRITSLDAAGFRIESNGTLSLQAGAGQTIYANSKLWARAGLEVSGTLQLNNNLDALYSSITAQNFYKTNGQSLVDMLTMVNMGYQSYNQVANYVAGLNLTTVAWVNSALATKESQIVAWANGKFVAK